MSKNAALITIHGMGDTIPEFDKETIGDLRHHLKSKFNNLHTGSIYYQSILQKNEEDTWRAMKPLVRGDLYRKLILYYVADAMGLESHKDLDNSPYTQTQVLVAQALYKAQKEIKDSAQLHILAYSLGCQVISCYLWDANKPAPATTLGIWKDIQAFRDQIKGTTDSPPFTDSEINFMKGHALKGFFTMGCNIPIFIAAHKNDQNVKSIQDLDGLDFTWCNYYDKDDWLGWPLNPLLPQVQDFPINAGASFFGRIISSWNTLSHTQYWGDDKIAKALIKVLGPLL